MDEMLARVEAQLKEKRRQFSHTTDPFIRISQRDMGALLTEMQKLRMTRERLQTLGLHAVQLKDV
ncbi:hypothetical protein SB766_06585 [Pseudomonas sp. SIMBA_077]